MPRLRNRDILPTAVKSRNLDNIIFGSIPDETTFSIGNGSQVAISFAITQSGLYEMKGDLYFAIYIGSVADANQLPGGSGIDETDWQIIGPYFDYNDWEDAGFPKHKDFITLYMLNISAGTVDVIIQSRWKYISPREGGTT